MIPVRIANAVLTAYQGRLEFDGWNVTDKELVTLFMLDFTNDDLGILLELNNNRITDKGAATLAKNLNKIRSLYISDNRITDVGLTSLALAMPRSSLRELAIGNNPFTDVGSPSSDSSL